MEQNDIFRLLLLVLLLANRQLDETSGKTVASDENEFSYTDINDLMILAMFLRLFSAGGTDETPKDTTF